MSDPFQDYFGTALAVRLEAYRSDRTIDEVLHERFPSNDRGGVSMANARIRRETLKRLREYYELGEGREPVGADLY